MDTMARSTLSPTSVTRSGKAARPGRISFSRRMAAAPTSTSNSNKPDSLVQLSATNDNKTPDRLISTSQV